MRVHKMQNHILRRYRFDDVENLGQITAALSVRAVPERHRFLHLPFEFRDVRPNFGSGSSLGYIDEHAY